MRRALWFLSAPVVAGGLAWAVNAADQQAPLVARAQPTQSGKVFYFSRSGKSAAGAAGDELADAAGSADAYDADAAEDVAPPASRYSRNRSASGASASSGSSAGGRSQGAAASSAKPAKNYYRDLFGQADGQTQQPSGRKPATASTASAASTAQAKAKKPVQRTIIEECGVNGESLDADGKPPRERKKLPPADASEYELVGASREDTDVRHADHKEPAGAPRRDVRQVQHNTKGAASKSRPSKVAPPVAEPSLDEEGDDAPPPPPSYRPNRTRANQTARASENLKSPHASAGSTQRALKNAPAAAARSQAAKKYPIAPASAEEDAAPRGAIQNAVATTSSDESDVPLISLRWVKNAEVIVGQECKCGLVVKNTGKLSAKDIVVEAYFPKTVKLLEAEPFPNEHKTHLVWVFDHLAAGEEKTIEISMIPGRRGELETSATVRYTGVASTVLNVEEPQLALSLEGPHEALVGETLTHTISISNPGTGIAHDVVIHAVIPEGLEHPKGRNVEMGVGSLSPGESRKISMQLSATAGGDSTLVVEARGASNLSQRAESSVRIAAPRLLVEVAGPGLRYVGRHAQYTITVTNEGLAANDNVRVVHLVPEGFEFLKADRGGKFDATTGSVSWFVGRLESGESMQVAVELDARQIGAYQHHVQASGESGSIAECKLDTRVDGTAAIVMEVADLDDPVEIDTQTAYEIRVRNDGSKAAQNVRIACELPQGVELVGTEGPTEHAWEKGQLHFKPLSELAAGGKVAYRLKVTGRQAGNLRLRARLTSSATSDPLIVEELTKFYAD